MKTVFTSGQLFGPFTDITIAEDRLICDGVHLPFAAISEFDIIDAAPPGPVDKFTWNGSSFVELPQPPSPVPEEISRARFIIALRRVLGVTEGAVFARISTLPAGEEQETARDLFENATVFRRTNPFLLMLAQAGDFTSEQIDEVFRTGEALEID